MLEKYNDLLTAKDLSEILKIHINTIYKEIRLGKFGESIKIGREYKIPKVNIKKLFSID